MLFVTVDHGGLGIPHGQLLVGAWAAAKYLCVVRAIHRLHDELVFRLATNFEELIAKFFPVTRGLIQIAFGDVGDGDCLIAIRSLDCVDPINDELAHH